MTVALLEQQKLLRESWELLDRERLDWLGHRHYKLLVEMGKEEIKRMFKHTHLHRQQKMLVSTMKWVMFNVDNEEGLRRLALYHAHLSVTEELLGLFGKALVRAMRDTLGERFTEEYQVAWATAYENITVRFAKYLKVYSSVVSEASGEDGKKESYTRLTGYFVDTKAQRLLALSDKEGSAFVSQYDKGNLPAEPSAHDRTKFRKRVLVLRGRYLYVQKKISVAPVAVIDVGACRLYDTSGPRTSQYPSPSPFSFVLVGEDGYARYFMTTGDNETESWYEALLKVRARFNSEEELERTPSRSMAMMILGEEVVPCEFKEEDFEMLVLIGRGTFGKVYKVKEIDTGKIYAVKALKRRSLKAPSQLTDLRNEKSILLNVSHPFIVKLHATFQSDDRLFLLFDFLSGGELFFHLQQTDTCFSEAKSQFYIAETCLAVSYLHEKNIVHRDLKAENLVLDAEGHVCLTDFGFARAIDDGTTPPNQTCGTLAYMAPEVFSKNLPGYGCEVDWWSIGVLLFNMLTLCYPFLRGSTVETVAAITTAPLMFPPTPLLSEGAVGILSGLLCKDPTARIANIEQVQEHPWYEGFDWEACFSRKLTPPFVPVGTGRNTKYFRPCNDGTSLASIAEIESQMEMSDFFDVHTTYLTQHVEAAQKGTQDALASNLDVVDLHCKMEP